MKLIACIMFLLFGMFGATFAQEKKELSLFTPKDTLCNSKKFILPPGNHPSILEGIPLDSTFRLGPKKYFSERNLYFFEKQRTDLGMPTYELPDPQSRMPIKTFGDSLNYTLRIKKYD